MAGAFFTPACEVCPILGAILGGFSGSIAAESAFDD